MFRRGFRRPLRPLPGEIPPALRHANELMNRGQYAESAEIFEQFARGAQARGGPRAPQFFLQAGRARILAGQVPAGMTLIQQGLSLLAARGDWQAFFRSCQRVIAELDQRGLKAESARIQEYLKSTLPGGAALVEGLAPSAAPAKKPVLPTNCPGCGAPIHGDEVEWTDEITAECPFCGSAVRAE